MSSLSDLSLICLCLFWDFLDLCLPPFLWCIRMVIMCDFCFFLVIDVFLCSICRSSVLFCNLQASLHIVYFYRSNFNFNTFCYRRCFTFIQVKNFRHACRYSLLTFLFHIDIIASKCLHVFRFWTSIPSIHRPTYTSTYLLLISVLEPVLLGFHGR